MSETEESPAQRQARVRREKREAKLKAGGTERLDKITRLSGRTPEMSMSYLQRHICAVLRHSSVRKESASPSPSPAPPSQTPPNMSQFSDPSQIKAQEEFLRSMLRAQDPQAGEGADQQQQPPMPEDPMMKLLSSFVGGEGKMDANNPAGLPFSPDDIQKATGMPSWATGLLMGGKGKVPASEEERKSANRWKIVHIVISALIGVYLLFVLGDATTRFGKDPPPPATVKNPFLIFVLSELLMHGSRTLMKDAASTRRGNGWYEIIKGVGRDGSIVLFMLGAANWWNGTAS